MIQPTDTPRKVRALVVDDSRLMRRILSSSLREGGRIEVVGTAADTSEARTLIKSLNPDVVTLDVEMPGMDGITFLRKIMELRPTPVVMVSTLTAAGADTTLTALAIGAVDALPKPAGREELADFGRLLREKVENAASARLQPARIAGAADEVASPAPKMHSPRRPGGIVPRMIAIGSSTGGVSALGQLLEGLPATCPPIVITQHMPPMFTARLAARLDDVLPMDVAEARDMEDIRSGMIRIAPGDAHLCVQKSGLGVVTRLDESGPISGHRPSVDVMFNSAATAVGRSAIGIILTGMGRDGAAGMRAMRNTGAYCIGQNERSCVVYGMPRAARELDAVDEELDLREIPPRVCGFLNEPSAMKKPA